MVIDNYTIVTQQVFPLTVLKSSFDSTTALLRHYYCAPSTLLLRSFDCEESLLCFN